MIIVNSHAAPTPTTRMQSNHECGVGSGSLICQQSKANAAATETMNCKNRIGKA